MSTKDEDQADAVMLLRATTREYIERQRDADKAKLARDDAALEANQAGVKRTDIAIVMGVSREAALAGIQRAFKRVQAARRADARRGW